MAARPERRFDLRGPEMVRTFPPVERKSYTDTFGNLCTRMTALAGSFELTSDAVIADSGLPDPVCLAAREELISDLP